MTIMQGVAPMPLGPLGWKGELLLRPAALLNLLARLRSPIYVKTHWANVTLEHFPACIPEQFTSKAIYMVRDPRSVFLSFSKFYSLSHEQTADAMNNLDFVIGGGEIFSRCLLSSWKNHVASWTGESKFPVHVLKYEDLVEDTEKELREVLEFLDWEIDEDRLKLAVEASSSANLQRKEKEGGFQENVKSVERGSFFNGGGSRWKDELGMKWIRRVEEDHGKIMKLLGYEMS
jgi:hypothetical protein